MQLPDRFECESCGNMLDHTSFQNQDNSCDQCTCEHNDTNEVIIEIEEDAYYTKVILTKCEICQKVLNKEATTFIPVLEFN